MIDQVADSRHPQWAWGKDLFWFAYIAAYPRFPEGHWPSWDPAIPAEGAFIDRWLDDADTRSTTNQAGFNALTLGLDDEPLYEEEEELRLRDH